jgi:glucose-1-phosphate cytidylyltransferase
MKVVLLAGGLGTRLREETEFRPKPMVAIGGRPILWHIMKSYAHYGHREFIVCLGYKGDVIRDYFLNYEVRHRDVTVTLGSREVQVHNPHGEAGWRVTLAETGEATLTAGRLGRVARYLDGPQFMVTYGDGVADIDLDQLVAFHRGHGKLATLTAVRPSSRFGEVVIENHLVQVFQEKPQVHGGWINGGFFVFERGVLDLIAGDEENLEQSLLTKLTGMQQLAVYQHHGFWQCMDTPREMDLLNELWRQDKAAWAMWR